MAYLAMLTTMFREDDAAVSGTPMNTARVAAREKLSRDVMEMTAEVKHRLKALRTTDSGAFSGSGEGIRGRVSAGIAEKSRKRRDPGSCTGSSECNHRVRPMVLTKRLLST